MEAVVHPPPPFTAWETFYVIVGSSAAALTGLQFVVIAILADVRRGGTINEIDAFATPTIVHFGAVLLTSGIMSAPWPTLVSGAAALGTLGAAGVIYVVIAIRRARAQSGYKPIPEDWVWYFVLPLVTYASFLGAAFALTRRPAAALFLVGSAAMLLLFIGIHNAWDSVTYLVLEHKQAESQRQAD
jgi:hypothetical protein